MRATIKTTNHPRHHVVIRIAGASISVAPNGMATAYAPGGHVLNPDVRTVYAAVEAVEKYQADADVPDAS